VFVCDHSGKEEFILRERERERERDWAHDLMVGRSKGYKAVDIWVIRNNAKSKNLNGIF
jgi:hypothetical protein